MANTLQPRSCAHHPDRAGFALCMSCQQVVCQECATTWDGIHHCRPCLAARAAQATRQPWWRQILPALLMMAAAAACCWAAGPCMAWALVLMRGWFR